MLESSGLSSVDYLLLLYEQFPNLETIWVYLTWRVPSTEAARRLEPGWEEECPLPMTFNENGPATPLGEMEEEMTLVFRPNIIRGLREAWDRYQKTSENSVAGFKRKSCPAIRFVHPDYKE